MTGKDQDQASFNSIAIIRHRGDPNKATTLNGERVVRRKHITLPDLGVAVACAPYDDHFVYWTNRVGQSALMCTCGSAAVVTEPTVETPSLIVCLLHASTGLHATGGTRWV